MYSYQLAHTDVPNLREGYTKWGEQKTIQMV